MKSLISLCLCLLCCVSVLGAVSSTTETSFFINEDAQDTGEGYAPLDNTDEDSDYDSLLFDKEGYPSYYLTAGLVVLAILLLFYWWTKSGQAKKKPSRKKRK